MTATSDHAHASANSCNSLEATRQQVRLGEVAEKLRALFASLAEIETEYPASWDFVQGILRDELDPHNKIPEGADLETWAKQRGAQPLEAFIHELEQVR